MRAIYRVGGSIGLVGGARSLLVFTRDPDDPDGEDGSRRALGHVKSNWGRLARTLTYSHEGVEVTVGDKTVTTNRLTSLGESDVAGTALLGADPSDSPATQLHRAGELIADMLGSGDRQRSKEIKTAAAQQGIPERTLKRAARDAGVSVESEGFPRVTYWRLRSRATGLGPTVDGPTGPTGQTPISTGDFDPVPSHLGQTTIDAPTGEDGLDELAPEQPRNAPSTGAQTCDTCGSPLTQGKNEMVCFGCVALACFGLLPGAAEAP